MKKKTDAGEMGGSIYKLKKSGLLLRLDPLPLAILLFEDLKA